MYVYEIASDDFIIVKANWPADVAMELIKQMNPSYVIIHLYEEKDYYYLYPRQQTLDHLWRHLPVDTVMDAFNLHGNEPTEVRDAFEEAEKAPDRTIVLSEGRVSGFLDATVPPRSAFADGTRRTGYDEANPAQPIPQYLHADFPQKVPLDETVSLLVSLSALSQETPGLPVALSPGSQIDVIVHPQRGFTLIGQGEATLILTDDQEPLPYRFQLKAVKAGLGRIRVLAFHGGSPLGALMLAPKVVAEDDESTCGYLQSHQQAIDRIQVGKQPDLRLLILENSSGDYPCFTIRLTAAEANLGLYLKPFGPVELRMDPLAYFEDFFQGIEDLPLRTTEERRIAEIRLASKGLRLFNSLFPEDLRVLLWELKDRITTIEVESEEPWIPWELCKLEGREHGQVVEGPFLCQGYAVTRWIPGIGKHRSLSLNNMGLVVPADSNLPYAPAERDYMLSLNSDSRQVKPVSARFLEVRGALASGSYDGWHFTGHGLFSDADPNRSGIMLESGFAFTPDELSGEVKNLGRTQPLVFLNACQVGRSNLSLTDIGGFAPQFLRAGAAAFIGTYWSIFDQPALEFAQSFYDSLLAGETISQATKAAREKIQPLGDPTWLAYTVYADPSAALV